MLGSGGILFCCSNYPRRTTSQQENIMQCANKRKCWRAGSYCTLRNKKETTFCCIFIIGYYVHWFPSLCVDPGGNGGSGLDELGGLVLGPYRYEYSFVIINRTELLLSYRVSIRSGRQGFGISIRVGSIRIRRWSRLLHTARNSFCWLPAIPSCFSA